MGRNKPQQHLAHLPNGRAQFLYAVRFKSGLIKIGSTCQPYSRAVQLQGERGEAVEEIYVQQVDVNSRYKRHAMERAALARAYVLCDPLPKHREYFSALSFADAVRVISTRSPAEAAEAGSA